MHLIYIPEIHTKDKEGNFIDKICARDFWKGTDSYRDLQNEFHKYITSKGFDLERGLLVEETGAKHQKIEELNENIATIGNSGMDVSEWCKWISGEDGYPTFE